MHSGPEQLRDWMARRFPASTRPQRDTADYFGWHESFITKLLNGERAPGLENATKIERLTGIPTESWLSSYGDESEHAVATKARKRQ